MVEPIPNTETDFSAQLQALVIEAEQNREPQPAQKSEPTPTGGEIDIDSIVKPILQAIACIHRTQNEQLATLGRIDQTAAAGSVPPQLLADAKQAIESRNAVSKAMFEALHTELKTYKDAFILESVLRPIIRDLISVYDDMFEIHRQLTATISSFEEKEIVGGAICLIENMRQAVNNLDHNVHFILEVLERLDVSQTQTNIGKLDKRTQKAVAVETTDNPDTDQEIVKILKRGFQWKDRIMRPEEVIIRKWKEPTPLSLAKAPAEAIPSI